MANMLISADDHIDLGYLPRDLWTERLPKALRERGPKVVEQPDGREFWHCDGAAWGDWRAGKWYADSGRPRVALDRVALPGNFGQRPTTAALRLEDMDRDGVEFSAMFPPIFGMRTQDKALARAIISAFNDWACDFGKQAPKRLLPIAQLFPDDAEASTEELKRIAKMGMRQVNFLVGTVTNAMYQPDWDPFWDTAEDLGIIVSYHVGGVSAMGSFPARETPAPTDRKPAFGMGLGDGATVFWQPTVGLFSFGVLERRPKLRFVLGESGTGWIPFQIQEMDYRCHQIKDRTGELPLKKLPSEVFRTQVWATYQQDGVGLSLVDYFGEGHMMWASDYPHPDSTWPNSQAIVAKETAKLSPAVRDGILRENARKFYALD